MGLFAPGAATRGRKTHAFLKHIPASQTMKGVDDKAFPLTAHGAGNVGKVVVYFPFPDAQCLGEFPPIHGLL